MDNKTKNAIIIAVTFYIVGNIRGTLTTSRYYKRKIKDTKFTIDFEDSDDLWMWINDGNDKRELKQVMADYVAKKTHSTTKV